MEVLNTLLSTQTPLLPHVGWVGVYRVLGWGLVLAGIALWCLRRSGKRPAWQRGLPLLLLLWCLWPGPLSPAYWLGLAFRVPSLLLVLLSAWFLLSHYRPQLLPPFPLADLRRWVLAPVLLGWVLLLDAFALWPFSLYSLALRRSPSGCWCCCACCLGHGMAWPSLRFCSCQRWRFLSCCVCPPATSGTRCLTHGCGCCCRRTGCNAACVVLRADRVPAATRAGTATAAGTKGCPAEPRRADVGLVSNQRSPSIRQPGRQGGAVCAGSDWIQTTAECVASNSRSSSAGAGGAAPSARRAMARAPVS